MREAHRQEHVRRLKRPTAASGAGRNGHLTHIESNDQRFRGDAAKKNIAGVREDAVGRQR